jgi:hypothetical protein
MYEKQMVAVHCDDIRHDLSTDHAPEALKTLFLASRLSDAPLDAVTNSIGAMLRLIAERAERDVGGWATPYCLTAVLRARHFPDQRQSAARLLDQMLYALMARQSLRHRIVPLVGQGVAAGVPQHVRVRLEPELGLGPRSLNHASEPSGRERCASL